MFNPVLHRPTAGLLSRLALLGLCAPWAPGRDQPRDPVERAPVQYWCGWSPRAPHLSRLLVDLRVQARAGVGTDSSTAEDVAAVRARGGVVRYRFHVGVVRAVLDTAAIRALIDGPSAIAEYATAVVDPARHDVEVQLFVDSTATTAVEAAVRAYGGQLLLRPRRRVLDVMLPDSAVPRLAQLSGVQSIRATGRGCAQTGGAPSGSSSQLPNESLQQTEARNVPARRHGSRVRLRS